MSFRSSSRKTPCPVCGRTSTGCRMGKNGELLLCRLGNTCDPRTVHPGLKVGAVIEGNWACVEINEGHEFAAFKQHEEPVEIGRTKYNYFDVHGGSIIKTRIDFSNGKKEFRSQSYKIEDLLPYKYETLEQLSPGALVFVTEGEKACDAMRGCGFNAIALPGSNYQPRELPHLRDRLLVWCPDRDRPGVECMLRWSEFYGGGQWLLAEPHNEAAWRDPQDGVDVGNWLPDVTDIQTVLSAIRHDPPVLPKVPWPERLSVDLDEEGKPDKLSDMKLVKKIHLELGDSLKWNDLKDCLEMDDEQMEDIEFSTCYMDLQEAKIHLPKERAQDVMKRAARLNRYHPIRDYLDSCTDPLPDEMWANVGGEFLGGSPQEYDNSIVQRWLVHAVRRIYEPGSPFGILLVLVGKQEAGKSRFFEELSSREWFNDGFKLTGKEADDVQKLTQSWIAEWGELDGGLKKSNEADIKAFVSRKVDRTREAYGQGTYQRPRQFLLCGTTNKEAGFFSDETGNRRFALYNVGEKIDCDKTRKWRDRIWASAVKAYREGLSIHLSETERDIQRERNRLMFREDPWIEKIASYTRDRRDKDFFTASTLLHDPYCIGAQVDRSSSYDLNRVKVALTALGWVEGRKTVDGHKVRGFWKPGSTTPSGFTR